MKLTIGFSRPKSFNPLSLFIRLFLWAPYSHVFVMWHSKTAEMFVVYQAQGLMLHFVNYEFFKKKNKIIEEVDLDITLEQYEKILKYCMQNAGISYGLLQLIGIGLKKIFRLKHNPLGDKNRTQICSELAARVLNEIGIYINNYDDVTPKDIHEIVINKLK